VPFMAVPVLPKALVQLSGSYDSALCGGMKVRRMRIACGNKTRESNRR
jgi:hypothetical protein